MDRVRWIQDDLMPTLVSNGCFSDRGVAKVVRCVALPEGEARDHFTSSTFFISLLLDLQGKSGNIDMVVKMESSNPVFRNSVNSYMMFRNEEIMYMTVIPMMKQYLQEKCVSNEVENICLIPNELFSKCYYFHVDVGGDSILVLEDLKKQNYKSCKDVFMSYDHCVLAVQELGKFHAVSYAYKEQHSEKFHTVVGSFLESRYTDNFPHNMPFLRATALRGVSYLLSQGGEHVEALQKLEFSFQNIYELMKDLLIPKEPLAVLCHGDYCKNNMFFKYDRDGRPSALKVFDFQLMRYSSPAFDLSFLLFANISPELRRRHLDDLFVSYHRALSRTLATALGCTVDALDDKYSLQSFREDFSKHSMYGYLLCSFFLPILLLPKDEPLDVEGLITSKDSPEDISKFMTNMGGEPTTKILAAIVTELVDRQCF